MSKFNLYVLSICLLTAPCIAQAEDWTTTDGKSYKNVKVVSSDAATVTIIDDGGSAKVPLAKLSADLQKKFNYDPETTQAANDATLDQKIREGAEKIRRETKSVKEVASDQSDFVGKPFYLQGKIDLSNYYNYGYQSAQTTHYAFKFKDSAGETATLYMARGPEADDLRDRILREQQPVHGLFSVVISPERFNKGAGSLLVELKSATFGGD